MQENFNTRLKKALILRNINATTLAKKTNINKSSISMYLSGKTSIRQDKFSAIAEALDISEAWLAGYDVSPERNNNSKQISLYSLNDNTYIENLNDNNVIKKIYLSNNNLNNNSNYFAMLLETTSMFPKYLEKDIVIFEKKNQYKSNDECVILVKNKIIFRKILYTSEGILLEPLNPTFEKEYYDNKSIQTLDLQILGVAIELHRGV